jgi:hypothetical protein
MQRYHTLNIPQAWNSDDPLTEDRYKQFYRFFLRNAKWVLDVNCATGRGGQMLRELDKEVVIFGLTFFTRDSLACQKTQTNMLFAGHQLKSPVSIAPLVL